MLWGQTKVQTSHQTLVSNYDYVDGEDHRDGVEIRHFDGEIARVTRFCGWRGTGTSVAIDTAVIKETYILDDGAVWEHGFVKLELQLDGFVARVALDPAEARLLAKTLEYKANEASKSGGSIGIRKNGVIQ